MEIIIKAIYILQVMSPTEYSNIQNTKYAREKTVIHLFIVYKLHGSNDRTVRGKLIVKDWEEVLIAKSAYESNDGLEELKNTTKRNQHNLCLSLNLK